MKHDHRTRIGRILKPSQSHGGRIVHLCLDGKRRPALIHRLVAEAFLGRADGRTVRFVNDDRSDARVENLYYGKRRCVRLTGQRNGRAKLTEHTAAQAKRLLDEGRSVSSIARKFGVSLRAIRFLRNGEHWSDLR